MKQEQIEQYIKLKKVTIIDVSRQTGLSRQSIYNAIKGQPMGRSSAQKLAEWSDGFLKVADLMKISNY